MSPAERPGPNRPCGPGTLYLFVRSERVEYGAVQRIGADRQWCPQASVELPGAGPAGPMPSFTALQEALHALAGMSSPQHSPRPQRPIRVLVADAWLAAVVLAWSPALTRHGSAQAYAHSQFLVAGFEVLAEDVIRMDDAPFEAPRLAVAYPRALLSCLREWAHRVDGRLASVHPLSVAAWLLMQRPGRSGMPSGPGASGTGAQALAVIEGNRVTIAHSLVRNWRGVSWISGLSQRQAHADGVTARTLADTWQRLCLREPGLPSVAHVALLDLSDGNAEPGELGAPFTPIGPQVQVHAALMGSLETRAGAHALCFQGVPLPCTRWQWIVLATLVMACAVLAVQLIRGFSSASALQARIAQTERARQPAATGKTWSREEAARVQAVNRAIRELNLPIDALLDALVPPQDIRVAVLSMETMGRTTNAPSQTVGIKILAQACSGADMARYVAFVAGRKPFGGAYLMRHEILDPGENCPYRFTVEARS
ncbi:hypothetical protein [Verminephrobacter aporrectodeae]|uniref:hypothetical protein n=2 Tax=Verminephrobacter aporrectodeae TaxID=1110389 RepID=UPI00223869B8|nr:hypothetical protein [Verminephrobacter aporrectodeae]